MSDRKYPYLDIPPYWEDYFTKYPNGYTMLDALTNWVSQVNNMVTSLNDWEDYLNAFVEQFDERLQEEVRSQLQEWYDNGKLAQIINDDVFGMKADYDMLAPISDHPISVGSSPKLIDVIADDEALLIQKKPHDRGYLLYLLQYAVPSVYGVGELLRPIKVRNALDAIVYRRQERSATGGTTGTWEDYSAPYDGLTYTGGKNIDFHRNTTATAGNTIAFTFNVGMTGKFTVGALAVSGSDPSAIVLVDDVQVGTMDLRASAPTVISKEFYAPKGARTVKIRTSGAYQIYIAGTNFYQLKDAPSDLQYDAYAYWTDDNAYFENVGAIEYAMRDEDAGYFVGSFHGYEGLLSRKWVRDGQTLSTGVRAVGKDIRLVQQTNINDKLTADSTYSWTGDGLMQFHCSMKGNINVSTFYTAMATTHIPFTRLLYPKRIDMTQVADRDYDLGVTNKVVQENPTTQQRVTTIFDFKQQNKQNERGVFIKSVPNASQPYQKVYYGPVMEGMENITDIAFSTSWLFE